MFFSIGSANINLFLIDALFSQIFEERKTKYLCKVFRLRTYLQYLFLSKGPHSAHSPFIFDLFEEVFNDDKWFYCFDQIEKEREVLLADTTSFQPQDHGAGSKKLSHENRSIQQVAKTSLKKAKYGRMLFRLIDHLGYHNVLELGTSLGITTCYLASAAKEVTTVEGDPTIAQKAQNTFNRMQLENVTAVNDTFDGFLSGLNDDARFDLIFIDGHHTGDALMRYFQTLEPRLNAGGCFVLDDIHWSNDMYLAWNELKVNERFPFRLDLFELGLLFAHPNSEVQDHLIRY